VTLVVVGLFIGGLACALLKAIASDVQLMAGDPNFTSIDAHRTRGVDDDGQDACPLAQEHKLDAYRPRIGHSWTASLAKRSFRHPLGYCLYTRGVDQSKTTVGAILLSTGASDKG